MNALKVTDYTTILPTGKDNAIPSRQLATLLGFKDARSLRADIARSRADGQPILSSTIGGYYMPATVEEMKEFSAVIKAKGFHTLEAAVPVDKAIQQAADAASGQLSINDME